MLLPRSSARLCRRFATTSTLAAETLEVELPPIKGSRFLGCASPCGSQREAAHVLERVKRKHPGASHVCWGQVLANEGNSEYCSDDGEPGGTAGPPILAALRRHSLTGVIVAVIRYYGGTNLGAGGLARAYGSAAAAVLASAEADGLVVEGWRAQGGGVLLSVATRHSSAGRVHALVSRLEDAPGDRGTNRSEISHRNSSSSSSGAPVKLGRGGVAGNGNGDAIGAVALEATEYGWTCSDGEPGVRLLVRVANGSAADALATVVRDTCSGQVEIVVVDEAGDDTE